MNRLLCAALGAAMMGSTTLPSHAATGFSGTYAVSNWTQNLNGGSLSANEPDSITLTGVGDNPDTYEVAVNSDLTFAAPTDLTVSFDWSYQTLDQFGPFYDAFYFVIGGAQIRLTDDFGDVVQSGLGASFEIKSGDTFGFRIQSIDSFDGAGSVVISNFSAQGPAAPVPIPPGVWLFGTAMAGLGGLSRWAKAAGRQTA